ncbi:uncharacterized protein SAPINGB_P005038 [Magnusiomyces paraingens]|uniref:F-box domain-containing protein n=1 Tax=Magnusiomyces paraingens TaxID=2606893 RepID=A0A5E8C3N4_9ASCO|nr:uncharacterized protein SAPINGB_P005038 [Saprochaete ingens]VVT56398.1 unnamed protein product [Saprochaete ingens]
MHCQNLQTLPNDAHYAIAEFLTGNDLTALSQVSKALRTIYNPLSFTHTIASSSSSSKHPSSSTTKSRSVPSKALTSPKSYTSWFCPQSIIHLAITEHLIESLPNSTQLSYNFPALVAIQLLPENDHPHLSAHTVVSFAKTKTNTNNTNTNNTTTTLTLKPTQNTLPVVFTAATPVRVTGKPQPPLPLLSNDAAAFAHIAHIALDLGWADLPGLVSLQSLLPLSQHVHTLTLKAIEPRLFAGVLAAIPSCWPNIETLRVALLVCWRKENIRIEAAIQHIPNIPKSIPNVVLSLDPLHDDDDHPPPLMLDFDRAAQLPDSQIVRAPAVSHVIMNECIGTKGDTTPVATSSSTIPSRRNAIEFPGLRALQLTLGVPWNRMSTAACSAHTLTTLYLRTNPNSHKLHQECLFWLLDDFREFTNLQRLAISFASAGSVKGNPLADFSPYFACIRKHYTSSNEPPNKKWLTEILNDSIDWAARPTLADWLQSLLISFAGKPDRAVVMMLPMFRMLAKSPAEFRAMTRTFLLEAFAEKCLHGLPRLEYLAVDFGSDIGVVSPGMTRLVNYHTGLKQMLVQETLLDGESMVFEHHEPHMATVLGGTNKPSSLVAQTVVDMEQKRTFTQPFFTTLPATESSICAQSNFFVQNFDSVFSDESFSGWL